MYQQENKEKYYYQSKQEMGKDGKGVWVECVNEDDAIIMKRGGYNIRKVVKKENETSK